MKHYFLTVLFATSCHMYTAFYHCILPPYTASCHCTLHLATSTLRLLLECQKKTTEVLMQPEYSLEVIHMHHHVVQWQCLLSIFFSVFPSLRPYMCLDGTWHYCSLFPPQVLLGECCHWGSWGSSFSLHSNALHQCQPVAAKVCNVKHYFLTVLFAASCHKHTAFCRSFFSYVIITMLVLRGELYWKSITEIDAEYYM